MTGERKAGLFFGLRFVLAGFEEEVEKQFVEEIVENGGQTFERYDSSCTHVAVVNLPLNDPICCAARKDGKALVTDFWITDCLETEALVDINHVLYRPLKDVDGIGGSKNLCICLTGYQGLARKNIMRMVEMMGAKFSKPLIGSQVTHLVCYKFEGEKYELAKKMGMALVNHFWLEDSLNFWTLLPESSYAQSGWEAETSKAQENVENVVDDSGEDDNVATQSRFTGKESSCDNVTITGRAQFLNETNGNLIVDDDLNEGPKSQEKSKSRQSLSPPPSSGRVYTSDIRRLEQMSTISNPPAGDFPLYVTAASTDNRNESSVPDVEEDESTHLYVEEGNESDHSCGRTSYEEAEFESDLPEVEMCEPVDAIATTCQKLELMDFATEHTTRQTASVANDRTGAFGDENVESSGIKRRRSSQFTGKEEPTLENSSPGDEEAKQFADRVLEENLAAVSALTHQPVALPGSNVNEEILTSPSGPGLPVQELPQEMEECDPKSISIDTSAMEIISSDSDHVIRDVQGAQGPSTENLDHVDQDHVMCDVQGAQGPPTENLGHVDQHGADADVRFINQEAEKSVITTILKEKKTALKTNVGGNNACSVTLAQVAQSYNPSHKQKRNQHKKPAAEDKENHAGVEDDPPMKQKAAVRKNATIKKSAETRKSSTSEPSKVMCFAVGGTTDERTKLHSIIKIMGARICKSRYQWRDEATHVILPGPLRRTEKFLAGAAAGRWILKPEYLEASRKAGKFVEEEAYEWYGEGTNDKGSISLLAPRKWRVSVATSGFGAFHGLRVLFHGECISPPLDTMKRAIKAGGGVVLATAPPYTRHLADGVNFAVISPGIPKEDAFVLEFLEHEVACVLSEYLVNLVCHPSSPLEEYILYGTEKDAQQHHTDIAQFGIRRPSLQRQNIQHNQQAGTIELENDDFRCSVCGSLDGEDVMMLCGPGEGKGCGVAIHIQCCTPPLHKVPDEDWYCSKCASEMI